MIEVHIRHGEASAETNWGVTEDGKRQAMTAAAYLRTHFPEGFTVGVHSGVRRAVETAELLGLSTISWRTDARLREAEWRGGIEPQGVSFWQEAYDRVAAACEDLDNYKEDNKVVVSHGGTLRMVRAYREGLVGQRHELLFQAPYKYFTNCQMIIYSDKDPETGVLEPQRLWVKSVCPWNEGQFGHDWLAVSK